MDIEEYENKVIELFKSGKATDEQWLLKTIRQNWRIKQQTKVPVSKNKYTRQ